MRKGRNFLALLLALFMVTTNFVGAYPVYAQNNNVDGGQIPTKQANVTDKQPLKITEFATKEQLKTFNTDNSDGSTNPAKVYFGNDKQQWWIAGNQSADSLVLFAETPLLEEQQFATSYSGTLKYNPYWGCVYSDGIPKEVYYNHYGASPLRTTLNGLVTSYFTTAEQQLINSSTIYTEDNKNDKVYSTNEKLYLAYSENSQAELIVGENEKENLGGGLKVDRVYRGRAPRNRRFWLRSPHAYAIGARVVGIHPGADSGNVGYSYVTTPSAIKPAFEFNLSSVVFTSAIPAVSSEGISYVEDVEGEGASNNGQGEGSGAFTLRYGTDLLGSVEISFDKTKVNLKNVPTGTYLVVQTNAETALDKGKAHAKEITNETSVSAKDMGLEKFENCEVWLETTNNTERKTYATRASQEAGRSVTVIGNTGLTITTNNTEQLIQPGTAITDITVDVQDGYYLPKDYENKLQGLNGLVYAKTETGFKISGTPTQDVVLYLPAPNKYEYFQINYQFISSDDSKILPDEVKQQKPQRDQVKLGETAIPSKSAFNDVTDGDGTWVFKGWDKQEVQNVKADVTFTGTWKYIPNKHKVTYKFEADGTQKELPKSIKRQLPKKEEYVKGDTVTPPALKNNMISVEDGVWTFKGWNYEKVTVDTEDITITGTWTFAKNASIINHIPTISAGNKIFKVGDTFNDEIALKDVTAYDDEDKDITSQVTVHEQNVNTSVAGDYTITYKVTDSQGATAYKTVNVYVYPKTEVVNRIPVITANDKIFKVGDTFNTEIALQDVTAYDEEDKDVTNSLEVIEHNVDTSTVGTYFITYKATDSQGASGTKTVNVYVYPKTEIVNHIPVIHAVDKTLTVGDSFDVMRDVTASDKEDGNLTAKIEVINNTVDTSKVGTYTVTYKVTDKDGASTTKTITVTVKDKDKEEQPTTPTKPDKDDNSNHDKNNTASKTDKPDTAVKTGDSTNILLWSMMAVISLAGAITALFFKRRRSR